MSPWIEVGNQVRWTPNEEHRSWEKKQELRSQEQGELLAEVRRRDGDACRVCSVVVDSSDRESRYSLNYRILNPGTTLTVAGVVVVCRMHLTEGDVQPAPVAPFYTEETANWLANGPTAAAPVEHAPRPAVVGREVKPAKDKSALDRESARYAVISAVTALIVTVAYQIGVSLVTFAMMGGVGR